MKSRATSIKNKSINYQTNQTTQIQNSHNKSNLSFKKIDQSKIISKPLQQTDKQNQQTNLLINQQHVSQTLKPCKNQIQPSHLITNPAHFQSNLSNLSQKQSKPLKQRLDNQFVQILKQLQSYYTQLNKHEQIRVQKWIVKIIQNDQNIRWKLNRNNYLKLLHHTVITHKCLQQPFDKMPDHNKDLPYLSQHDLNQKIKPMFDGKSPTFHIQKPQMIKIKQPIGDSCSVLMSLINTTRTNLSKQNNHEFFDHQDCQTSFKQSKLLFQDQQQQQQQTYFTNKNAKILLEQKKHYKSVQKQKENKLKVNKSNVSLINDVIKKKENQFYGQSGNRQQDLELQNQFYQNLEEECNNQEDMTNFCGNQKYNENDNEMNKFKSSSVLLSNLPSQVKSNTATYNNNKFNVYNNNQPHQNHHQKNIQKNYYISTTKYKNHQKYHKNSVVNSNTSNNFTYNHFNGNGCKTLISQPQPSQQISIYKQLVLLMGRLLLKHEFTIQRQSEYWKLMRIIYEYQCNEENQQNNFQQKVYKNKSSNNTDRLELGVNFQSDRVEYKSSNKLLANNNNHQNNGLMKGKEKKQTFEEFLSRLRVEIEQQKGHNITTVCRPQVRKSQAPANYCSNNYPSSNHTPNPPQDQYPLQQNYYHITQQSTDFKIQQGVLYFQLNQTQRKNQNQQKNVNIVEMQNYEQQNEQNFENVENQDEIENMNVRWRNRENEQEEQIDEQQDRQNFIYRYELPTTKS